ncbi:MAG: DNA methyltransferase, partial [Ktedonobacterales bacterium]
IQDHLETTMPQYQGKAFVIQGSATSLDYLPDESVDLVFTDPPFGANINYSEMNILWESWLGRYTDARNEAIVNAVQGKDVADYQRLMTESLRECYRVLRSGHWMLLVFMNSSHTVWTALRNAIADAGFTIRQADIFDKQHGTFKQFVSDNTAGCDLVLHCWKPPTPGIAHRPDSNVTARESIEVFLRGIDLTTRRNVFLHVRRDDELDFRKLYSEWMALTILEGNELLNFADFRAIVLDALYQ